MNLYKTIIDGDISCDFCFHQNRNITQTSLAALESVGSALLGPKVPGESPTVLHTDTMVIQLQKQLASGLAGASITMDTSGRGADNNRTTTKFEMPSAGLDATLTALIAKNGEVGTQVRLPMVLVLFDYSCESAHYHNDNIVRKLTEHLAQAGYCRH